MTEEKIVEVGAAVIIRADGSFLLAERPIGKVYEGYWEFPGGKIEVGETTLQGLIRELHEELGIEVQTVYPWLTQVFTYPHATVRLHFFRVTAWQGEPQGRENQRLAWQHPNEQPLAPMLPANTPIFRALSLPSVYAITNAGEQGESKFLDQLHRSNRQLIQVREPSFADDELAGFAERMIKHYRLHDGKVLINRDLSLAKKIGAEGIHLSAKQLKTLTKRPDFAIVGVSCHNREELERAVALEADFAVLGPVMPTKSHPNVEPLGWPAFAELATGSAIPIYAIGGLKPNDLDIAWQSGAHGIAMQRAAW